MQIPTNFIIFPQDQTGEVYGTEFTFTSNLPPQYTKHAWDFGDRSGLIYNDVATKHIYNYPGIYTVQLSSWTDTGEIYVDYGTIDVDYVYRDSVLFTQIPESNGLPGVSAESAFIVSITSAKIDQPLSLVLQSFNSKSVPRYSIPEKWNFITPNWRFIEADGKVLEGALVIDTVPIYSETNPDKIVAVKGEKVFYYIDDLSTGLNPEKDCPLMLVATLSTERFSYPPESLIYPYASYSNSEVARAVISWQINDVIPTKLRITDNFIHEVYHTKWANVPIPILITLESTGINYTTTALSYPRTNELGQGNEVVLSLSSNTVGNLIEGVHYEVPDAPLHFRASDEYGNVASGYIFTTIKPLTSFEGNVVINASTTVQMQGDNPDSFAFPVGYPIQSNVYVSHPAKNVINRLNVYNAPTNCDSINKYRALGILVEGSFSVIPTTTDITADTLSGSNVYALTFNPIVNRLYTADIELNTINCYAQGTELLTSVNLEHIFNTTNLGPSHISVDRDNNVWVSLFDDRRVVKFDYNLNYLLSAIPVAGYHMIVEPVITEEEFLLNEDATFLESESLYEENVELHPPIIETDRQNNVWVCYPSDGFSTLYKLSSTGQTIAQAGQLPGISYPVSLSIDASNSVWVACKNTNNILKFSTDGVLLSTITGVIQPSYIAHDRSGNLCILHGYNFYSIYNITTNQLLTWKIDTVSKTVYQVFDYEDRDYTRFSTDEEDEIWGGLTTDVFNRVWVVDTKSNNIASFKPTDPRDISVNPVLPSGNYTKYFLKNTDLYTDYSVVSSVVVNDIRSAQAGGDWSGNRWYQKYGSGSGATPVQGTSAPFTVNNLDEYPSVVKINNNFDYADHFRSLALPEILQQNTSLFEFLSAAVGDSNPNSENAGRVIYEKIANFVSNKGDVDTSDVKSLLSMAEQFGVDYKEFGQDFPVAVNELIDLFSVSKHKLRGVVNIETDVNKNIGNIITETDNLTANRFYLAIDKITSKNLLVWVNPFNNQNVYPASNFITEALRTPVLSHYNLFVYNSLEQNKEVPYVGNLIDWENPHTTLSWNVSSEQDWYGDGGVVETMFNKLLTKQLIQQ